MFLRRERFPFWATDRAEQNSLGIFADLLRRIRESHAVIVDSDTADVCVFVVEREAKLVASGFKDIECDIHDFRADAITGENCEF